MINEDLEDQDFTFTIEGQEVGNLLDLICQDNPDLEHLHALGVIEFTHDYDSHIELEVFAEYEADYDDEPHCHSVKVYLPSGLEIYDYLRQVYRKNGAKRNDGKGYAAIADLIYEEASDYEELTS